MEYQIKLMETDAEKDGKAFVHYTAWNETYRGLMPKAFLDSCSLEKCRVIAHDYPENTLVALSKGEVVGFSCYLPQSRKLVSVHPSSEIVALYVLKDYQRCGIGEALIRRCLTLLPPLPVALFVLEGNQNAIGFYRHQGFVFTGNTIYQDVPGGKISEVEMLMKR